MRQFFTILYKECVIVSLLLALLHVSGCEESKEEEVKSTISKRSFTAGDYLSARFAETHYDVERAINYYNIVLSKDPNHPELLETLYSLLIRQGNMDKAFRLAERHAALQTEAIKPRLLIAIQHINNSNYTEAQTLLSMIYQEQRDAMQLVALETQKLKEMTVPLLLAWSYITQSSSEKTTEDIVALIPDFPSHYMMFQRALLYELHGDREKAKEFYAAIDITSAVYRVADGVISFYHRMGDREKAESLLREYKKHNPYYAYEKQSVKAADIRYHVAVSLLEIAGLYLNTGMLEDAMEHLQLALYLQPDLDDAHIVLGSIYQTQGLTGKALASYERVATASRFYWKAQVGRAIVHSRANEQEAAKKILLTLGENYPERYEALLILGDILLTDNKFEEAAAVYTQALDRVSSEHFKEVWSIYYARGICYEQAGQWDKAEPDFFQALELAPDHPSVLNYLGYSWLIADKNLEQAETLLFEAIKKRPGDAHIIDSYGWALYKLEKYEEAVIFLERANLLIPYDPTTNDHLGDVYWRLGRYVEAQYQWQRALTFEPEPEDKIAIQHKLSHGLAPMALAE